MAASSGSAVDAESARSNPAHAAHRHQCRRSSGSRQPWRSSSGSVRGDTVDALGSSHDQRRCGRKRATGVAHTESLNVHFVGPSTRARFADTPLIPTGVDAVESRACADADCVDTGSIPAKAAAIQIRLIAHLQLFTVRKRNSGTTQMSGDPLGSRNPGFPEVRDLPQRASWASESKQRFSSTDRPGGDFWPVFSGISVAPSPSAVTTCARAPNWVST